MYSDCGIEHVKMSVYSVDKTKLWAWGKLTYGSYSVDVSNLSLSVVMNIHKSTCFYNFGWKTINWLAL